MKRLHVMGLALALLSLAVLVASMQAAAAKPQANKVKQTAKPVWTLAMDGPRVAYMTTDRKVAVWNVATGATTLVRGTYPSKGNHFGYGSGEVAIAGKRVALITRFVIGNTQQTQERLYTASLGGSAHQLGSLTNHSTGSYEGGSDGNWLAGAVGSGKFLAVSTWKSNDSVTTRERLSLVTPTGLRTIVTGPDAIVAQAADGGHIAVLRSTEAWPAEGVGPVTTAPTVGIYSTKGALLREIALSTSNPPSPDSYYPYTIIRIALSGNQLVVLNLTVPEAGFLTSTVEVYNWTTGALVHTWPLALGHSSPGLDRVAVYGKLAAIEGPSRLYLLDLTTGKDVVIARASGIGCPAAIGLRGLVYAVNSGGRQPHGKLVFVPRAKLLAALS